MLDIDKYVARNSGSERKRLLGHTAGDAGVTDPSSDELPTPFPLGDPLRVVLARARRHHSSSWPEVADVCPTSSTLVASAPAIVLVSGMPSGAVLSSQYVHRPLPTRLTLPDGEALDSFLERLTVANDVQPAQMLQLLREPAGSREPSTAFLMVKPAGETVERIRTLSGASIHDIKNSTLMRFDGGLPLELERLDPRRRHSFREVVAQGWFPPFGTQACPLCLAVDGRWRVSWRLPLLTVCLDHGVFLTDHCDACRRRFRSLRYSPLRPQLRADQLCGNSISLRNPCQNSVLSHTPLMAPAQVLETTRHIANAIAHHPMTMFGSSTDPYTYLAELRHLATLLLHLLSRPTGRFHAEWACELHTEAALRTTTRRGPRWGISPPHSAVVRGNVLAEAEAMLAQTSLNAAAAQLEPWLTLIADQPNGPSVWLKNRTTRSRTMEMLIRATTERRHHVGRRLNWISAPPLPLSAVPQLLDEDIHRDALLGMLGGYPWTGRLYASLCVARLVTSVANWSHAASCIGLDPDLGTRTARAASARLRVDPHQFAVAVEHAARALPRDRDFRKRESRVSALARDATSWHNQWRTSLSPARRPNSLPYAIAWMWCEVAQCPLDTSPGWTDRPTRQEKAAYRAFRAKLPPAARDTLRALVLR